MLLIERHVFEDRTFGDEAYPAVFVPMQTKPSRSRLELGVAGPSAWNPKLPSLLTGVAEIAKEKSPASLFTWCPSLMAACRPCWNGNLRKLGQKRSSRIPRDLHTRGRRELPAPWLIIADQLKPDLLDGAILELPDHPGPLSAKLKARMAGERTKLEWNVPGSSEVPCVARLFAIALQGWLPPELPAHRELRLREGIESLRGDATWKVPVERALQLPRPRSGPRPILGVSFGQITKQDAK